PHLDVTGELVALSRSELATKIPGRVAKVFVDEGQRVRTGEPLLRLETEYFTLDVERARADLARAKAVADEASSDFARKKDLRAKDSIPQSTFDRSQAAWEQARASLSAADTGLRTAQQRLADATLRAPFDGVVVARHTDVGERLSDNTVAFVISQTAPLKLRFDVPERYLASVRRGMKVTAGVDPYPGTAFDGEVNVVGGTIDSRTRTFFVEALFPNHDGRLRPGMFARVKMDLKD
ncbi:MAG: efflux RND transporter periplasmic adaptor subunit, partial [Thermoanaerobaculia bacterium]